MYKYFRNLTREEAEATILQWLNNVSTVYVIAGRYDVVEGKAQWTTAEYWPDFPVNEVAAFFENWTPTKADRAGWHWLKAQHVSLEHKPRHHPTVKEFVKFARYWEDWTHGLADLQWWESQIRSMKAFAGWDFVTAWRIFRRQYPYYFEEESK